MSVVQDHYDVHGWGMCAPDMLLKCLAISILQRWQATPGIDNVFKGTKMNGSLFC